MAINLTDELNAATKKGKIASAKQVYLEGDQENLQQIGDKTHQLEQSIKDISVSGGASTANAVSYNNETSGMTAVNAQAAIDELAAKNKAQDATMVTKADAADVTSKMQTEQTRVNGELAKKFDKSNIAQELGDSEDKVVSQSALPFREIESPEFLKLIVDAEDHVLFGIQLDGSIEWGKGIPSPIRAKLQEIINQSQQDKTDLTDALNAAKEELNAAKEELNLFQKDTKEYFKVNLKKTISILGDSLSTFAGYVPTGNATHYPNSINDVASVEQTWWMKLITDANAKIDINESWAGAQVSGINISSFTSRIEKLGNPNYIIIHGGTNDSRRNVAVGNLHFNSVEEELNINEFSDAYDLMIRKAMRLYPHANIIVIVPNDSKKELADVIINIAKNYNLFACVDLRNYSFNLVNGHYQASDMVTVENAVLKEIFVNKNVLAEEGKSLIDGEVKECFKVIENEEFIHAITDSEDRLLFGIYRATGKPYFPLNDMYHVEQNEEFFAAWLDAADHVLLGIRRDGEIVGEIQAVNALKQVISQLQSDLANLQELLSMFSIQENEEYLALETDADGKVLSTTNTDGSHYIHNVKSETIDAKVDKEENKSLIDSDVADAHTTIEDPEGRMEVTTDKEGKIIGYRDSAGKRYEHALQVKQFYENEKEVTYATRDYVNTKAEELSEIDLSKIDGVVDYSLKNLFDKSSIRTYDSDFAAKVFAAIGRKTGETGCYSNNIPCKEGDWFTRNDFGTGIVVVLDNNDNIIGDIKNVAYKPTFQIKASDGQDFSNVASVVIVVMLNALDTQRIVKAKYVPSKEEDAIRIPKLKIGQENIELGITTYVKGSSGRFYSIGVDDSSDTPQISLTKIDGIPTSELPSDFPKFSMTGDFTDYYDSLLMCPISGGASYLFEIGKNGMVTRYRKSLANCPKTIVENGTQYYYGIDGNMNESSGKLFIYEGKGETFTIVKGNITDTDGNLLEPHDCCVISINPLHIITQRYVENQTTIVDGIAKTVTSLVLEEQYEGKRVWQWNSVNYPELWKDSHYKGDNADYLHNNTISIDNDGNLLINNKQANQMLVIERSWDSESNTGSIGDILWKIGGNQGDGFDYDVPTRIKTTEEQQWYESHDAIVSENGVYSMFDNRKSYPSRIIEFKIDKETKALVDFKAYTYKSHGGRYMGSVDKCKEGVFLVSWGSFRSTESSNIGIYDFNNDKAIFELSFENKAYNVYRVYGIKKQ